MIQQGLETIAFADASAIFIKSSTPFFTINYQHYVYFNIRGGKAVEKGRF